MEKNKPNRPLNLLPKDAPPSRYTTFDNISSFYLAMALPSPGTAVSTKDMEEKIEHCRMFRFGGID
jgi:hypothetical protein